MKLRALRGASVWSILFTRRVSLLGRDLEQTSQIDRINGCGRERKCVPRKVSVVPSKNFLACVLVACLALPASSQQSTTPTPVVVQPGAPGQPTKTLPPHTNGVLPPL